MSVSVSSSTAPPGSGTATLSIAALPGETAEGSGKSTTRSFVVTRTGNLAGTSKASWAVSGVAPNGAGGDDFVGSLYPSGSLEFAPDVTSLPIIVEVAGDTDFEQDETFRVGLLNPGALVEFGTPSADALIENDDSLFSIAADVARVVEGHTGTTAVTFTITREGATDLPATVAWTVAGSGTNPASPPDFAGGVAPFDVASFGAGDTAVTITVQVAGDSAFEPDEDFVVTLSKASAKVIAATATIENDDLLFSIAADTASVVEGHTGTTAVTFTITRDGATDLPATVAWTVAGSGTNPASPADFAGGVAPFGVASFGAGDTRATITVQIAGDSVFEPDEDFVVTLSKASAKVSAATATIVNDDCTLSIAPADARRAEGQSGITPFTFRVTRSGPATLAVTAKWTVTGLGPNAAGAADFAGGVLPSGSVFLDAGQTAATVTVWVAGDTLVEPTETFAVTLSAPSAGASIKGGPAVGTILDDEANAVISIGSFDSDPHVGRLEGFGATSYPFFIEREGATTGTQEVTWQISGEVDDSDFVDLSGKVTFSPGMTGRIVITPIVIGDDLDEPHERFTVTIATTSPGATIGTASADGIILNDDTLLSLVPGTVEQAEGTGGTTAFLFTVQRTGLVGPLGHRATWSVAGTGPNPATAADFAAITGMVDFLPLQATATITVPVVADARVEPDEGFTLTLSDPRGVVYIDGKTPWPSEPAGGSVRIGTFQTTGTILNDDKAEPATMSTSFSIAAANAVRREGNAGTTPFTFTVTRSGDASQAQSLAWQVGAPADVGTGADPLAGNEVIDRPGLDGVNGIMFFDRNAAPRNAGIANSWSIYAKQAGGQIRLLVYKDLGSTWQFVGASPLETVNSVGVNTFSLPTGIPVGPDTVIAFWYPPGTVPTVAYIGEGVTLNSFIHGAFSADLIADKYMGTFPDLQDNLGFAPGWHANPRTYSIRLHGDDFADADDFAGNVLPSGTVSFAPGEISRVITIGVATDSLAEANERFGVTLSGAPAGTTITAATATGVILDDDTTLLKNGGFETGDFTGWSLNFTPPNNVARINTSRVNEGKFALNFGFADVPSIGTAIWQSFATIAGQTYRVAYHFGNIGATDRSASLFASVFGSNGSTVLGTNASSRLNAGDEPTPPTWSRDAFTFVADGATATLQITDTTNPGVASDALLDNVVVELADATTIALAPGMDSGSSASDGITNIAAPTFTGAAAPGAAVTLLDGATPVGTGKADAAGLWSIKSATLADKLHSLTAVAKDAGGATIGTSPVLALRIDTTAPTAPSGLALNLGSDTGAPGDNITENAATQVIDGTGEAGATVTLFADGVAQGTAQVDGKGQWSFPAALGIGKHSLTATATDPAGNTGPASTPLLLNVVGPSQVSIAALDASRAEGNAGTTGFTFTVTRTNDISDGASVKWSVAGSGTNPANAADFAGGAFPSGTVTFAAGEASQVVTVNVVGDGFAEADNGFTVTLAAPSAGLGIATAFASGTILNDDAGKAEASFGTSTYLAVATPGKITWAEAETAAEALGGHLATIGSAAENNFIYALANDPIYWSPSSFPVTGFLGPWLGGYQPAGSAEPAGGWAWVTGEPFTYTAWAPLQPDNVGNENRLQYFQRSVNSPIWNDINELGDQNTFFPVNGYVVEFDGLPLSYPGFVPPTQVSISASDATLSEGHAGSTAFIFTVTRSGVLAGTGSVGWSVAGSGANPADAADFAGGALPSGIVSFAAGEASQTLTVNVAGDTAVEPDEGFTVTLASPSAGLALGTATATGTIQNDDATVSIAAASATKPEGNSGTTAYTFTVTRTGATAGTGSVKWSVAGSGANPADAPDFAGGALPSGIVSFAAGEASQTVTVTVAGDTAVEPDEGFTVTLASPSAGLTLGTATATGTIQNDDATVSIAAASATKPEGNSGTTAYTFTVTRTGATAGTGSLKWATTGSGANPADATDFAGGALPSGTVTFAAGQASQTVTVTVAGDTAVEPDEGFTVTLASPSTGLTLGTTTATGTIQNDDGAPGSNVSIEPLAAERAEGSGGTTAFTFTVSRSGSFAAPGTVDWSVTGVDTEDLAAADELDFAALSGTISFAAGESSRVLSVPVRADTLVEGDEAFLVALSNPTGGIVIETATALGVIADDDTSFAIAAIGGPRPEGTGGTTPYTFTVTRSGDTSASQSVSWKAAGAAGRGTVPANAADFAGGSFPAGTITFAPDDTAHDITVMVAADSKVELNERFAVLLSAPTGGATLGRAAATAVILNDDAPPALSVAATTAILPEGNAGPTFFAFTVTRSGDSSAPVSAAWSVSGISDVGTSPAAGSDFVGGVFPSGSVSLAAGETVRIVSIAVQGDTTVEADERFAFTLSAPTGGAALGVATALATIANDDAAGTGTLSIARLRAARAEGSGGTTPFTFTVTRSGNASGPAAASWNVTAGSLAGTVAANAADFAGGALPSGKVSFAGGETSRIITVAVAGDTAVELNESFNVVLSSPAAGVTLGTASASGLIHNDDSPGTGSLSISRATAGQAEGASGSSAFLFTVARSGDTSGTASADWAVTGGSTVAGTVAANGADFAGGVLPSGRVNFAAGQTAQTVTVLVAGDTAQELNESFTVSLSGLQAGVSIGSSASAAAVILNDDYVSTAANQTLTGTSLADTFLLGGGLDTVTGAAGLDRFLFQPAALGAASGNATTIQDLNLALGEKLDLSAIDAIASTAANDAFTFIGTAAFDGTAGQLRWQDQGGGMLLIEGNVNTDTTADLTIFLKAAAPVDANWFVL